MRDYELIVVGSGASGMMAAITYAKKNKKVLLLEKLPKIALKLKASGGGRCNLTNTLSNEEFISSFAREGKFMRDALEAFDHKKLQEFFKSIGVQTHAPDGLRIFPTSHNSFTIIEALENEMKRLGIEILTQQKVQELLTNEQEIIGLKTKDNTFYSSKIILATGGLGYPTLGGDNDGHHLASALGHKITELFPAMLPLHTKETWVKNTRADTLAKVQIKIDLKKANKLKATGDLIFTNKGIRGPVILDFAREITPLLQKYGEVPLLLNFTKGMNEEQITKKLKDEAYKNPQNSIHEHLKTLLPDAISKELCLLADIDPNTTYKQLIGANKAKLIKLLAWTPLTVVGHDGFKSAMVTRGGINLKDIDPKTMQSKIIKGLYFCGELLNIDGPCGGYNLQWAFASGYLAGEKI